MTNDTGKLSHIEPYNSTDVTTNEDFIVKDHN